MKTKLYNLHVGKRLPAKEWSRKGKAESAHMVNIQIDLFRATNLLEELQRKVLSSLLEPPKYTEDCKPVNRELTITLFGELEEYKE